MNIRSLQNAPGPRRGLTFMLALGAVAGILLWAKLRLVSNMPRSVYAEPKQVDGAANGGANGAGDHKREMNAPSPEEIFEAAEAQSTANAVKNEPASDAQTGEPSSPSTNQSQPAESENTPH
jgi:hypothetical protein